MTPTTTSSEPARNLSIPDLLRILNDKLYLECIRLREYYPPPAVPTASLEIEVSLYKIYPSQQIVATKSHIFRETLQIENLETRAHDVLRVIPLLRNMLQPINRLPPEILSRIAQCFLHKSGATDTKLIVPLTHVCQYWRGSITSDAANWTLISNHNEHLMALTLERAKAAPLQASLTVKEDPPSCSVPAPYVQNVDSLQVTNVPSIEVLKQALPGFPQSTPNLRSLKLVGVSQWGSGPVDPFESLTPTLRYLELRKIPLYPSILRLRSLTELLYVNAQFRLSLDTLLEFLEENASLERVTLAINYRGSSSFDSQRQAPIKNNLRYLSIHFRYGKICRALLSGISLQRGADLDIFCYKSAELHGTLAGVSLTHHLNLDSPTFIEYRSYNRGVQLLGQSGRFSLRDTETLPTSEPFEELPLLPLSNVREFRLIHRIPDGV